VPKGNCAADTFYTERAAGEPDTAVKMGISPKGGALLVLLLLVALCVLVVTPQKDISASSSSSYENAEETARAARRERLKLDKQKEEAYMKLQYQGRSASDLARLAKQHKLQHKAEHDTKMAFIQMANENIPTSKQTRVQRKYLPIIKGRAVVKNTTMSSSTETANTTATTNIANGEAVEESA